MLTVKIRIVELFQYSTFEEVKRILHYLNIIIIMKEKMADYVVLALTKHDENIIIY